MQFQRLRFDRASIPIHPFMPSATCHTQERSDVVEFDFAVSIQQLRPTMLQQKCEEPRSRRPLNGVSAAQRFRAKPDAAKTHA